MILHSNPGTNHQMVNSFQDEKLEIKVNMWPTHKLLLLMEVGFFLSFHHYKSCFRTETQTILLSVSNKTIWFSLK